MAKSKKNKPTYFRFLDLFFILYYFVTFVCYLLHLLGVSSISKIYLLTTWFTFPFILGLILSSFITLKQILFTKFPISFKVLLRIFLSLQFVLQIMIYMKVSKDSNLEFGYGYFLICNGFIFIWSIVAFIQKILNIKVTKIH
jgi:hypothetical protein